jgi:hypothetical protein
MLARRPCPTMTADPRLCGRGDTFAMDNRGDVFGADDPPSKSENFSSSSRPCLLALFIGKHAPTKLLKLDFFLRLILEVVNTVCNSGSSPINLHSSCQAPCSVCKDFIQD